jgi:putative ABC transport system permease protein
VTALHRKLVRDLWHLRGQVAAIALVVICGVATVVTTRTAYESLVVSQALYYAEYRFADVFASLKRAPEARAPRSSASPGVETVHTRLAFEVTLDVEGLDEPATGRLVSIPERRVPILNDIHIRRGRRVEPGRRDEILVSESFARSPRSCTAAGSGSGSWGWRSRRSTSTRSAGPRSSRIPNASACSG